MYILTIDQSTSATKALLVDRECQILTRINKDHKQFYPQSSWVEHDPEEIYQNLVSVALELVETVKIDWQQIKALSISNQRETVVVWDKTTGKPIYNAIVWQCARATELCKQLDTPGNRDAVRKATGLMLSPYFSAAKIMWVLENVPGAREKAKNGELLAGTIDSWLVWKLTGGAVHATDYSNASRMSLFNLTSLDWDENICNIFNIPVSMLPEVKPSDCIWGETDFGGRIQRKLPIAGILGDSHAALFAQQCYSPGMAKATYGTGSSVMMNVGTSQAKDVEGIVSSIGWGTSDEIVYVLEGNINCTGATIKWLVDSLKLLDSPKDAEKYAMEVESTEGVYLVPAFSGLSAPYWDNEVRAMICGMSFNTGRSHIIRAGLEAIAYQIADIVRLMTSGSGMTLSNLRTDGGPTRNNFLMQFQADMLGCAVLPAQTEELSALGVAMLGGLTVKMWNNRTEFSQLLKPANTFTSSLDSNECNTLYAGWRQAVNQARGINMKV